MAIRKMLWTFQVLSELSHYRTAAVASSAAYDIAMAAYESASAACQVARAELERAREHKERCTEEYYKLEACADHLASWVDQQAPSE